MPVERIIGTPDRRGVRISGRSTSSNEAIFIAGTPSAARLSTASWSNGRREERDPASARVLGELGLPLARQRDRVEQLARAALVRRGTRSAASSTSRGPRRCRSGTSRRRRPRPPRRRSAPSRCRGRGCGSRPPRRSRTRARPARRGARRSRSCRNASRGYASVMAAPLAARRRRARRRRRSSPGTSAARSRPRSTPRRPGTSSCG